MSIVESFLDIISELISGENTSRQHADIRRIKPILVKQMKSQDNSIAVAAASKLRKTRDSYRDLTGGRDDRNTFVAAKWTNFTNEKFSGANLEGADLSGLWFKFKNADLSAANLQNTNLNDTYMDYANLSRANLREAYMEEVHLLGANLQHANLERANISIGHLHGADFSFANLQGANLRDARMHEVNFFSANLAGVYLEYANFTNANLENANFDGADWGEPYKGQFSITLPDGTKFTSEKDIERFTNPMHPKFWRPISPVVWGDGVVIKNNNNPEHLNLHSNSYKY